MKKLITILATITAATVFAATPKELIDAGKYVDCINQYSISQTSNMITTENAPAFLDAACCMTNYNYVMFMFDNRLITADALYAKAKTLDCLQYKLDLIKKSFNSTTNEHWRVEILESFWNENYFHQQGLAMHILSYPYYNANTNPRFVLNYSERALKDKHYNTAAAAYRASLKNAVVAGFCLSNYVVIAKNVTVCSAYNDVFVYMHNYDIMNGDFSTCKSRQIYDTKYNCNQFFYLRNIVDDHHLNKYPLKKTVHIDYVKNSDPDKYYDSMLRSVKALDRASGNDEMHRYMYEKMVSSGCNYIRCLDFAIMMNDVDKMIDQLLKADNKITAKQVNACIEPINAVDADYRKADILKALNNINSRCTIKLYDDPTSWEPIISKVRAMISVRK